MTYIKCSFNAFPRKNETEKDANLLKKFKPINFEQSKHRIKCSLELYQRHSSPKQNFRLPSLLKYTNVSYTNTVNTSNDFVFLLSLSLKAFFICGNSLNN